MGENTTEKGWHNFEFESQLELGTSYNLKVS